MIKYAIPKNNKNLKITLDEFVEKFNNKEAILVDIRMPFERNIFKIPFALEISPEEIEEKIDTLPKDKLIVIACPNQGRSPFAAAYLKEKGFNAKFLENGLINLMQTLRGGEAKKLKV
ncbi:rhodanese-like domain-containing protein [Caminibacter mediatlanticus]|uniref:Rhodanese domain-containing protein n=1 Tax=Caminibacter mediatlanticus TB-2 TaxID=391592 RepID=A0AAI9AFY7_9BACT|nr:rhodanese-like domain-containing protein [Caminibacter mediatlanticus]EDM22918.1 hypothetical protein CMTB2_07760 [Caminibacter mediatlanticus TB-2]